MLLIRLVLFAVMAGGCGGGGGGATPDAGGGEGAVQQLKITIVSPTDGAKDVAVSAPVLKASFSRELKNPDALEVVLQRDGKSFHGVRRYSATNLEVTFKPFNLLESRAGYTFSVSVEGASAKASFTTAKANEGPLPPIADKTYDFRLKQITYPEELAAVFNSQLQAAPPVLMHVVHAAEEGTKDGNTAGSFLIAGSTGKVGDAPGKGQVLPEDATHTTTTSMAIAGRSAGSWFAAGPSDLHTTASGVAFVIRDFYVTGLFAADGSNMSSVTLTGLVDPAELGKSLKIDLGFICTDARFTKYCDAQKRIRLAAAVETAANPIAFTTFVVKPINNSADVDPASAVQLYFTEEPDAAATAVTLSDASGAKVAAKLALDGKKGATLTPDAPLAPKTAYTVEAKGVAKAGGASDTRHLTFTTR